MKKIILLTLVVVASIKSFSAPIDTVYFRNMTFSWQEWKWLIGGWNRIDSSDEVQFRRIDAIIDAVSNITGNTNVTVDSIPGKIALLFYAMGQGASRGEARTLPNNGNNFRTVIRAYPPIVQYCDLIDANWDAITDQRQKRGKFLIGKSI